MQGMSAQKRDVAAGEPILTIQLGHYANHVGAHLWNIQDAQLQYTDSGSAQAAAAAQRSDATVAPRR